MNLSGKPDAGNLLVRFDVGDHGSPWSLLYRENDSFVSPSLTRLRIHQATTPRRSRTRL